MYSARVDIETLRRRLFDPSRPTSFNARARAKRWGVFQQTFPELDQMRVLDLGGTPGYWVNAPVRPASVRCVNLDPQHTSQESSWIEYAVADACERQAGDYDLVVSNSLIEHVGGHERRLRLSEAVHAAADRHWVQTPYRYFPIEPHWMFPGFQFFPASLRMRISKTWPVGHIRSTTDSAWADVSWVELLSITDMRGYFSDSAIWLERYSGAVKSLVAVAS